MILLKEFAEEIRRLHQSFGLEIIDDKRAQRLANKIKIWFDSWKRRFPNGDLDHLSRTVDEAIERYDRVPSFKSLSDCRSLAIEKTLTPQLKIYCNACEGSGGINAMLNPRNDGMSWDRRSTFRCGACQNWIGKYSPDQPQWGTQFEEMGWVRFDRLPETPGLLALRKKGVQMMKEAAPKLFARMKEDCPDLAALIGD